MPQKLALNSGIEIYQFLTNDHEICIQSLSSILLAVFFTEKKSERFRWFLMLKNDFKSTNFATFEEVVHNFDRSDDAII